MFCKDKSCTTKGEQDIMLGIFKNRGNTTNKHKLEYLVKHNYIKNHREAWKIKEEKQSDSRGIIVNSNKKTEEYSRMTDDETKNINESNVLKISNYSKNTGSPVVSRNWKFKGKKRSVIPNSKLLRYIGSGQDSRLFFSQTMHGSKFGMGQDELCSKCQLQFQSKPKSKRNCNSAKLIAPPNSPADESDSDVLTESERNESNAYQIDASEIYQADELPGMGGACAPKTSSNNCEDAPEPARRSINVFIPVDKMGEPLT